MERVFGGFVVVKEHRLHTSTVCFLNEGSKYGLHPAQNSVLRRKCCNSRPIFARVLLCKHIVGPSCHSQLSLVRSLCFDWGVHIICQRCYTNSSSVRTIN